MPESFKTGKCQNWVASKYSYIRRCQKLNLSEFSKGGKCQSKYVRILQNQKMSESFKTGKHHNLKMSEYNLE